MGGNKTHSNLLMVYHPKCKASQALKAHYAKLASEIYDKKVSVNVLAINDGMKDYRKILPGNLAIHYYPMVFLLKNDED